MMDEGILRIRLGTPDEGVDFTLLEQLGEHLRAAFREIVWERVGDAKVQVRLRIQNAQKGSLILDIQPELEGDDLPTASEVAQTLIDDINSFAQDKPRPTIGSNLLGQYRALVGIGQRAGGLELGLGDAALVIDKGNEIRFQAARKEQPEPETRVVGHIEMASIHRRPRVFALYTKLDRERVECRFADDMLDAILRLIEEKALVEVFGEATFGPVGVTPRLVELLEPPRRIAYDPEVLRAYRRSADIVHDGESAAEPW